MQTLQAAKPRDCAPVRRGDASTGGLDGDRETAAARRRPAGTGDALARRLNDWAVAAGGWRVIAVPAAAEPDWLQVEPPEAHTPAQGWKLHVSAGVDNMMEVLETAFPVLAAAGGVAFKVAASAEKLSQLNEGLAGATQVGKFLTLYPTSDDQAVRLALALHDATRGLKGPRIPSDRPLRPGSLVQYRYGAFAEQLVQDKLGVIEPALRTPDGRLLPDRRDSFYRPPDFVTDPFVAAGIVERDTAPRLWFGGRYLAYELLHQSPRTVVRRVVDRESGRQRVLKEVRLTSGTEPEVVTRARVQREAALHHDLPSAVPLPAVHDCFEADDSLFLVFDDITGQTLESLVGAALRGGRPPAVAEVIRLGAAVAGALAALHEQQVLHNDIKPANIMVTAEEQVVLLDLDIACQIGQPPPAFVEGTPGFLSPGRLAGAPPAVSDEVYALGATLYFLATGAMPSRAPDSSNLLTRPPHLLRPELPAPLCRLIERCLAADAAVRPPSMAAVRVELMAMMCATGGPGHGAHPALPMVSRLDAGNESWPVGPSLETGAAPDWPVLAGQTLRALAASLHDPNVTETADRVGSALPVPRFVPRDLNQGTAGVVLALAAALDTRSPVTGHRSSGDGVTPCLGRGAIDESREGSVLPGCVPAATPQQQWTVELDSVCTVMTAALRGGCARLLAPPALPPLPGLFVGEAGVAVALLQAGRVLGDSDLIEAALAGGRQVAAQPLTSPDLFNGAAGRLRSHLLLWRGSDEPSQLRAAEAAASYLLEVMEQPHPGEAMWSIPEGYGAASGKRYLGYAHGVAGIADALLDLFAVNGNGRLLAAAMAAARTLERTAVHLEDGAADWPDVEGGALSHGLWCHGAAGIARFLSRLSAYVDASSVALLRDHAAVATAACGRWTGPTLCHGLAGKLMVLRGLEGDRAGARWSQEAHHVGQLLAGHARGMGETVSFADDSGGVAPPALLTGSAGIALALLNLSGADVRPMQELGF